MRIKKIILAIVFTTGFFIANAQMVWENPNHEVYNYLNRLAAKGLVDFRDIIRPISQRSDCNAFAWNSKKKSIRSQRHREKRIGILFTRV
jgi:hypothetical protein